MHQFSDQLFNGITLGMLYILVALGLNIILGLMGVINFSHGAFFMLGAYIAYTLAPHVGFWPSVLAAALIIGLFGMLFESALIRPLYRPAARIYAAAHLRDRPDLRAARAAACGATTPSASRAAGLSEGSITVAGSQFPVYKDVFLVVVTIVDPGGRLAAHQQDQHRR